MKKLVFQNLPYNQTYIIYIHIYLLEYSVSVLSSKLKDCHPHIFGCAALK